MAQLDRLKIQVDIAKSKLMAFLAIAGGSWVYGLRPDINAVFIIAAWLVFTVAVFGVFVNIVKLSEYEKMLKKGTIDG